MMKVITLLLLLMVVGALNSHGEDAPLTATELAVQLHVSSWVTKIDLGNRTFEIAVVHVVDGKVQSTLLTNDAWPTNRPFERIVILASQTPLGTKVSIQPGSSGAISMGWIDHTDTVPLSLTKGIDDTVTEGDYFLGGSGIAAHEEMAGPIKIQDVKDGLVLRLHPKE